MTNSSLARPLRLCFVADYRSPHARNWISHLTAQGHETHVLSTFPAEPDADLASLQILPIASARLATFPLLRSYFGATQGISDATRRHRLISVATRAAAQSSAQLREGIAVAEIMQAAPAVARAVRQINPDLVHAMRFPYEGLLAARAVRDMTTPFIVSVWGQDFVTHAAGNRLIRMLIRRALRRLDGLHADCWRDIRLAHAFELDRAKPFAVLPSGGGIDRKQFTSARPSDEVYAKWGLPTDRPIVFNPRNFRPRYVRTKEFFAAVGIVQREMPNVCFVCAGMEGNPAALEWRERLPEPGNVRLLPLVTHDEMAELFRMADISISPSISDGTPNSMLEAMACGALPVAGNTEPIREWIEDGVNGLLCEPESPESVAAALRRAITDEPLRKRAAEMNSDLVNTRAERSSVMRDAVAFYRQVLEWHEARAKTLVRVRAAPAQTAPAVYAALDAGAHVSGSAPRLRVLALMHTYLPGFQSGGPVRSLSGLVDWLGDELDISIITRDRDKDETPYTGVQTRAWQRVGKANVYYAMPDELGFNGLRRIIRAREFDVLYLNSYFNPLFTFRPLLLKQSGAITAHRTILAPRGEFSVAAQQLKATKKLLYSAFMRTSGLLDGITWHASSEHEAADIRRSLGGRVPIVVARNLSPRDAPDLDRVAPVKVQGRLRIVTLSRIAPIKNLLAAIEMVRLLQGEVEMDIYGPIDDGAYWASCSDAMLSTPPNVRIRYLGPVRPAEARATMAAYDLFFLPTLGENYGHSILDALVASCPVVISDRTPWRDLERQGVGWDVPLNDRSTMIAVLQRALYAGPEEWQAMRRRARALGVSHASDAAAVEQNRELFLSTAQRQPGRMPVPIVRDAEPAPTSSP